jgi:hypothetical protein
LEIKVLKDLLGNKELLAPKVFKASKDLLVHKVVKVLKVLRALLALKVFRDSRGNKVLRV